MQLLLLSLLRPFNDVGSSFDIWEIGLGLVTCLCCCCPDACPNCACQGQDETGTGGEEVSFSCLPDGQG